DRRRLEIAGPLDEADRKERHRERRLQPHRRHPQSGNTLGRPNAPVTMQYFGDLQCPVCKSFTEGALQPLIQNYVRPGILKIEFRSLETATREPETFRTQQVAALAAGDRKSTRLNSSHLVISYAVFCLKKKRSRCSRRQKPSPHVRRTRPADAVRPRSSIRATRSPSSTSRSEALDQSSPADTRC